MSRRAMRRGSRGNSAPGSRNSSAQQTSTAMMFLTPSAPNLEGLDLEDDNGTKDTEDTENGIEGGMTHVVGHSFILTGHSGDGSMMSPELEASRQLLIENLIGMVLPPLPILLIYFLKGFPVDWALRAAENCDPSASESTAIAWIIERFSPLT
jgi:hypothetical protein